MIFPPPSFFFDKNFRIFPGTQGTPSGGHIYGSIFLWVLPSFIVVGILRSFNILRPSVITLFGVLFGCMCCSVVIVHVLRYLDIHNTAYQSFPVTVAVRVF